jgi:formamidopyrimidine-DNA glycosylase
MPELPEVETVVRTLAPRITGWRIVRAETRASRVFRGQQAELQRCLPGQRIHRVTRYGKNILVELESAVLRIHLGMTGKLLLESGQSTHPRAVLWLEHPCSGESAALVFDDIRQFGRFELLAAADALGLGPEPLEWSRADFLSALATHRGAVKSLLLNQRFVRGMGNIYTDEALYQARIHPLTPACAIPRAKATALYDAMIALLREAIAQGGSSVSDYVDAEGRRGAFQEQHQVYGRQGEPCPRCGKDIRRMVVSQRGTHFCPHCQRLPRQRGNRLQ